MPAVLALRFYRSAASGSSLRSRLGGGSILMFNKRSRLHRVPYGVVGVISPWNYPFSIPFSEVAMALLAGNGVLLKVASDSLAVGRALADLFSGAGLPEGLFAYVNLPGREAGDAFISGGIDKLFFTGSTEVGRELMGKAAARLLPVVLELGGNDAAVICADADLERAAAGIVWSGFSNAGQSCAGAQRILVHESDLRRLRGEAQEAGRELEGRRRLEPRRRHGLHRLGAPERARRVAARALLRPGRQGRRAQPRRDRARERQLPPGHRPRRREARLARRCARRSSAPSSPSSRSRTTMRR